MRQHPSLRAVVFTAFVLAWLVALAAGIQARTALAQLEPPGLCTTAQGGSAPYDPTPAGQAQHHSLDCLLCVALATPPAIRLAAWRSPVPVAHRGRHRPASIVLAWQAQAPLPARGPPAPLHA